MRLSKQCLTRFIWPNRDIQEATVVVTWSLKDKLVSRITPRSLAAFTGVSCFPISESWTFKIKQKDKITRYFHPAPFYYFTLLQRCVAQLQVIILWESTMQ